MKFSITRILSINWVDQFRKVKRLRCAVAESYAFVTSTIKNNKRAVGFDSFSPGLKNASVNTKVL